MGMPSFPSHFPSDCPPAHAKQASGAVFRIVTEGVLAEPHFQSHYEAGTVLKAPACGRCGVSVFDSLERALHRLRLSPHLGTAIAKGELAVSAGMTQLTNERSGHVEWWPFDGVSRRSYFAEPAP